MEPGELTKSYSTSLWLILLVTISVQVLATFTALSLAAIAPEVATSIKVSPELVGYQISLLYLGAAIMSTAAGYQLRRWGPIRVSQTSLMFCAVGAALAIVPSVLFIAIGSFIIGLGYGMTNPAASEMLLRSMPADRRNLIFSIKQTGVPIGGALAGLLSPFIGKSLGWQWSPAVAGFLCVLLVFFMQPMRSAWDSKRGNRAVFERRVFDAITIVWSSVQLRWLSICGFFYAAVQLTLAAFVVTLLVSDVSFDLIEAGLVLALVQVSGVLGRVFWGWVADRVGHGLIVLMLTGAFCLICAFFVMSIAELWNKIFIYILFIILGFNALGWTGVFQVEATRYAPVGQAGAVIGGITAPSYMGVIVGPSIFSLVYILSGSYTNNFILIALFATLGMFCLFFVGLVNKKSS